MAPEARPVWALANGVLPTSLLWIDATIGLRADVSRPTHSDRVTYAEPVVHLVTWNAPRPGCAARRARETED